MTTEPKGRAKGGFVTAAQMTSEELESRARKGAAARWGYKATHKGSFKEDFGADVECYVLNDDHKTPVISQTGMAQTIGLSARGNALPRFLATQAMQGTVGADLREKLENPIKFQWGTGGAEQPPTTVYGFDATLLIDLCKAIIGAESSGKLRNPKLARQASIIINATAKSGIQNLVYRLAGYDATRQEVIEAFKFYVREEAREYEKEFPSALYDQWYRLYQLPKPERGKAWKFRHLTVDQVYKPLAKSSGKVYELTKVMQKQNGVRYQKLHQFLSEVGVKALRTHLGQLLGIAQVSKSRSEYEKHVDDIFGDQRSFDF